MAYLLQELPVLRVKGPVGGILFGAALHIAVVIGGVLGFTFIEGWPLADSFYMTIISITTVGFSEVRPLTTDGRVFTSFIIIAGLGTVFYTTTMLGRFILEGEFRGTLKRRSMKKAIAELRKHSIICGYGRSGRVVAEELHADGFPFCIIENDKEKEVELSEAGYLYIIGDATDERNLLDAGIERALDVMGLLDTDADNLYLTLNARELQPDVRIITRAESKTAYRALKRAGANTVIEPFKIFGNRILHAAVRPTISEFFELVSDRGHLSLVMEEITLEGGNLLGQTLEQARIRADYGVIIIAFKKKGGNMVFNPSASEVLEEGDTLALIGEESALQRMKVDCSKPSPA